MGKLKVAAYGEFMAKHIVFGLNDINLLSANYLDNKKYEMIDSFGGAECNVLATLSALGIDTKYASCFGKDELSQKGIKEIKNMGIDVSFIKQINGKLGDYYFLNDNKISRENATKYFRHGSAINKWNIQKFNFDEFFKNVKIFHVTGISFSLDNNENGIAYKNGIKFINEAQKRNIDISVDINYRPSLWNYKCKNNSKKAIFSFKKCILPVLKKSNILFVSKKDLVYFLDYSDKQSNCPDYIKKTIFKKFPNLKILVIRNREKVSNSYNIFKDCIISRNDIYPIENDILFPVTEPIGGGDAFVAGVLYGLLKNKKDFRNILDYANKVFITKHQITSDYINKKDLDSFMKKFEKNRKMKVLIGVEDINDQCFIDMKNSLSNYCNVVLKEHEVKNLKGIDILIDKKLSKNVLKTADKLKAIFTYKTGIENFPLKELAKKNIELYNSHINSSVIAKYAFGLLVSLLCKIPQADNRLRKGKWNDGHTYWELFDEKKIGILGYGCIGKEINKLLRRNDIDTYTIKRNNRMLSYDDIHLVKNFDELINTCDVIISSLPATNKTNNLFNKKVFSRMKGKYFINVGRGNVFNDIDLYNALKNNVLAGAAIDSWKNKYVKGTSKRINVSNKANFSKLENIILSPHQAMMISRGHKNYIEDTQSNVINYLLGCKVYNKINYTKGY